MKTHLIARPTLLSKLFSLLVVLTIAFGLQEPTMVKADSAWNLAAPMNVARYAQCTVLMPDGKVLVIGGFTGSSAMANVEMYDPVTNEWTTLPDLSEPRYGHSATLLLNGKV